MPRPASPSLFALAALVGSLAACDTLPNDDTTDLCAGSPPHADCERCRTLPRDADCPQCTESPADPDCETAAGMGGAPPLNLLDARTPDAAADAAATCDADSCADGADAGPICSTDAGPGCPAERPICNTETLECVECTENADCPSATPKCDLDTQDCVECLNDTHCAPDRCDSDHVCVECLTHTDCDAPTASRCTDPGVCAACETNADCTHLDGHGVCDDGECVECIGNDYAACGADGGTPLVCDSLARACSDQKEESAGLCQPCLSDAQCDPGQLCVLETFDGEDTGYYCVWRKNAGVGGAPTACSLARPFVGTRNDATSIDGVMADVCGLALTTCDAYNDFRNPSVNCEPTADAPDDTLCGRDGSDDAYCRYFDDDGMGDNFYRCTMPCGSDDDCKTAFTCNTAVTPNVCTL